MKSLKEFIYESYGEFKDGYKICKDIYNELVDKYNDTDSNVITISTNNYNFNSLKINSIKFAINTNCKTNVFGYNYKETDIYNNIAIEINVIKLERDNSVNIKLLLHELTHAIQDLYLRKIGECISKYMSKSYKSDFKHFIRVSNDIVNNKLENTPDIYKLKALNYLLNISEQNAYLSSLKSDIFDILDNNKLNIRLSIDYNKLLDLIKHSNIWDAYFSLKHVKNNISTNNKLAKEIYCDLHNIYKSQDKQKVTQQYIDSFVKSTKKSWDKFEEKFNKFIPKICAEYYETHVVNN